MLPKNAQPAQVQTTQAQPAPRVPQSQVQGNHVIVTDSVMMNENAVGRNIVLPNDEKFFSTVSDVELANGSFIEGIRATTVLSHMTRRLCERSVEAQMIEAQMLHIIAS